MILSRLDHPERDLAAHWRQTIADPAVAGELIAIYADTAAAITSRGPACWASGRCCNFDAAGHRLYVTGLEAAYTLRHLEHPSPPPPLPSSPSGRSGIPLPIARDATDCGAALTRAALDDARARGGCPFQVRNLCGVHAIKPLGCRIYFCDRSAQAWQEELAERQHARVKSLHDRRAIAYRYGEWRDMLDRFLSAP